MFSSLETITCHQALLTMTIQFFITQEDNFSIDKFLLKMSSTIDDNNDRDIISTQQESSSVVTNVICESNPISAKVEFADANYSDEDEQKSTEDDNHPHGGVIAFDQYDLDEFPIDSNVFHFILIL